MNPQSVVAILRGEKPIGSGFAVGQGLFLTCAHLIRQIGSGPGREVRLRFRLDDELRLAMVDVHAWDEAHDLALLRPSGVLPEHGLPLPLISSAGSAGRSFRSLGYLHTRGTGGVAGRGTIAGPAYDNVGRPVLQLASPELVAGFSGAPVWDEALGGVVGMVKTVVNPYLEGENRNMVFAIPSEVIWQRYPDLRPSWRAGNPFGESGRIENLDRYLVRQPLTDQIWAALRQGHSLSITGAAQAGKSSLLWYLAKTGPAALRRPLQDFLYLDLRDLPAGDEFFDWLCDALHVPRLRGKKLVRRLFGQNTILLLDEIEKTAWQGLSAELCRELCLYCTGQGAVFSLVIASRAPLERLVPGDPQNTAPLAELCQRLELPPFSLEEAFALARQSLQGSGLSLPEHEIENAWRVSQGHPARLQQALKEVYEAARRL
jgi:hypothetical protein